VAHQLGEHLAQARVALAAPVLERARALLRQHLGEHVPDHVEGERGGERHAAREADDLRAGGDREQRPDLGGGHRAGATGVTVAEGVVGTHAPKDTPPWRPPLPAASIEPLPGSAKILLVPSPSLPLLRRVGGSFLVGALVGMLWALLVIHRRPRLVSGPG